MFFFFNDTATTEIYTLSLHDALPICRQGCFRKKPGFELNSRCAMASQPSTRRGNSTGWFRFIRNTPTARPAACWLDRKSTRLNSSHLVISYAVFCLKKKRNYTHHSEH